MILGPDRVEKSVSLSVDYFFPADVPPSTNRFRRGPFTSVKTSITSEPPKVLTPRVAKFV
jgi:hypothetical protein